MTELISRELSANEMILDPNNYRFQDSDGFVFAAEGRFHEASVQERAYE